ncbi:hypothetical protein [Streptomyces sp. NPDC008141]
MTSEPFSPQLVPSDHALRVPKNRIAMAGMEENTAAQGRPSRWSNRSAWT